MLGCPALRALETLDWAQRRVFDYQLLRILAVGSLCLMNVPLIRASSRNFTVSTLHMAPYFGANDLGFGAFDEITADRLKLQPITQLEQVNRMA